MIRSSFYLHSEVCLMFNFLTCIIGLHNSACKLARVSGSSISLLIYAKKGYSLDYQAQFFKKRGSPHKRPVISYGAPVTLYGDGLYRMSRQEAARLIFKRSLYNRFISHGFYSENISQIKGLGGLYTKYSICLSIFICQPWLVNGVA